MKKINKCPKCGTRTKDMRNTKGANIRWCGVCQYNVMGFDYRNGEWIDTWANWRTI